MKDLRQFLVRSSALGRLGPAARTLSRLTEEIRSRLPAQLAAHVQGCAPRGDGVVILADSAAWASQLRYAQTEILSACREHLGGQVRQVRFKIVPADSPAGNPSRPVLSPRSRELLRQTAEILSDKELAEALRKLGREPAQDD